MFWPINCNTDDLPLPFLGSCEIHGPALVISCGRNVESCK